MISIKISLKFIPKGPIDNIPILVQIIANLRMLSMLASNYDKQNKLSHNSLASLIPMVNLHLLMQSISG